MTKGAWLPIALIVALSCKQGPSPEAQARIDSLSQASAQKDRLVEEIAENTRFVSEISAELAKAAVPPKKLKVSSESPLRASRDTLIQKIRYITARVREIEPKLQDSERRISELTSISDSLRNALAATMQNLQGVIDSQKEQIAALTEQVETLSAENVALKDPRVASLAGSNTMLVTTGITSAVGFKFGQEAFIAVIHRLFSNALASADDRLRISKPNAAFSGALFATSMGGFPAMVFPRITLLVAVAFKRRPVRFPVTILSSIRFSAPTRIPIPKFGTGPAAT